MGRFAQGAVVAAFVLGLLAAGSGAPVFAQAKKLDFAYILAPPESGAVVAVFGWQVAELNGQSFSPALNLNLRWLYLSAVVGGALMIVYSLAALREAWRGRPPGVSEGV